ncbi:monofunctional biosynthetic peptidoglycan transglycosylase [Pseudaestuariivita atlantica]|uniref:Biosynthetic peptidoglycan transglycosylase n=1 Tax=Pseudaestuariivita atlantica TaxID=1317121 RepID=A0A0L1JPE9_9RHOB|nr:monofunctional biosynthetic peptidoglycan transglycosylase [Pseudaestuariivita atlantica]KNG93601.1 peptidoglycan transglycosylase [Pseudaestuariivita atlantica]
MARAPKKTPKRAEKRRKVTPRRVRPKGSGGTGLSWRARLRRWLWRWVWRGVLIVIVLPLVIIAMLSVVNPPMGPYMRAEAARLGGIDREWVPMEEIAPVMARSAVAAEDANFCLHWGIDMDAMRAAIESGGARGGSTITQQVVKNVFLWHGRSYTRKALEAGLTPLVELFWSKRRILEVYLNVAEFDEGVFGVEAAARHYFGVGPDALSPTQAARLAAILPAPKTRSASRPSTLVRNRASRIAAGAATIEADGRAACFEG